MRKNGKYINCFICNKSFYLPKWRLEMREDYLCSRICKGKYQTTKRLEKAVEPFNKSWQELIYQWYVFEKISIREITRRLKLTNRLIPNALRFLNIKQRSPNERVSLQWVNNPSRRGKQAIEQSKRFKGRTPWNKGLTKDIHKGIKRQAKWMKGSNNPMYGKFGKLHHLYKHGLSISQKRAWGRSKYQNWRKVVFERDNYTCQKCGDNKGGNLEAHHIKSWDEAPKLRFIISNGKTLCSKCHHIIHKNKLSLL